MALTSRMAVMEHAYYACESPTPPPLEALLTPTSVRIPGHELLRSFVTLRYVACY